MTLSNTSITVDLPSPIAEQLEEAAHRQRRSVRDLVRDLILEHWNMAPSLPEDQEEELAAFRNLSDDVLWLIARTTLSEGEQAELAELNELAHERALTSTEVARQETLLSLYEKTMVRRGQAALVLQSRAFDLSDPSVLSLQ